MPQKLWRSSDVTVAAESDGFARFETADAIGCDGASGWRQPYALGEADPDAE
jgi:hypothetical protein